MNGSAAIILKTPIEFPSHRGVVYTRIDSIRRRCGLVLRGKDVLELEQMKQMGLSISAISEMKGENYQEQGETSSIGRIGPGPSGCSSSST